MLDSVRSVGLRWAGGFVSLMALLLTDAGRLDAAEKNFFVGGISLTLQDLSDTVGVRYQSMRLNRALNVWNVEVSLTNRGAASLQGPFILLVDAYSNTKVPLQPDGHDDSVPAKVFFDLSNWATNGVLAPGAITRPRTLSLVWSNAVPNLATRVYARPASALGGLAITRTLNEVGQPLTGVQVIESGPQGQRTNSTDATFGVITLGQGSGDHVWRFESPNYLPAWRRQTLTLDSVTIVSNPRLVRRSTNSAALTPIGGGQITNDTGSIRIRFTPGAFAQNANATLTPLTGQTLPAFLPLGWSPMQAFWLELDQEPAIAAAAQLVPWGPVSPGETVELVRWDMQNLQWIVQSLVPGAGTNSVTAPLAQGGAYALVLADPSPLAPPAAQVGLALQASAAIIPAATALSATGNVEPSSSPASRLPELVTATASVLISNRTGVLPSGLLLRCEVKEDYRLRSGNRRILPQHENFIVGYQRPGDNNLATLTASFPLRPLLLLGAEELNEATVNVDVVEPTSFSGGILDATGGEITAAGIAILAATNDLTGRQAGEVRTVDPTNFVDFNAVGLTVIRAFDVTIAGVSPGHHLAVQFSSLPTNAAFVLAKVLSQDGLYGLQPVDRLRSDPSGAVSSLEPSTGARLPGLTGAGQYALLQVATPHALIMGIARNAAGQPAGGLPVRIGGAPWLTFSDPDGSYRLVAPTGTVQVAVTDLTTGDSGQVSALVTGVQTPTVANLSPVALGPIAAMLTPTNGAAAVARVSSIVVSFSEPINPGTLGTNGLQLFGASNTLVNASLTLDLRNTTATLLPIAPLAPSTLHLLLISTNIADFNGRRLGGTNRFTFKTASDALDRIGGQLLSYEPTNGLARMAGGPGIADPNSPVILVNQTSGRTVTILSNPDGSFTNVIAADVDDFLSAVLVNQNGTRTAVPVSRQLFHDGSVGLFNGGGILEAQSDGGPVQVLVEPGAIGEKTRFKIDTVSLLQLTALLSNTPPQNGQLLGGLLISQAGDELKIGADLSFPINPAVLNLPVGAAPEDASFALVVPHQFEDGNVSYEIIDRMVYENGKLVTHSPPYLGLLLKKIQVGNALARRVDKMSSKILHFFGLPDLQETTIHLLALPIMLAQGHSITVFGRVASTPVDTNGVPVPGAERVVPGAFVTASNDSFNNNNPSQLGKLFPGQFFATAGSDGRYSFYLPLNSLEAQGFILTATHPRFPHQRAIGGETVPNLAARLEIGNVLSVPLFFVESTLQAADLGPDTDAPLISIAQSPQDPPPGTNASAGAFLTVTATDDRAMGTLTLATNAIALLNPLDTNLAQVVIATNSSVTSGAQQANTYRITSDRKAQVNLLVTATDAAGNTNAASYNLIFDGDRVVPVPPNTNDHTGPRVIACWPVNGAAGVQPFEPIRIRFSEPISPGVTTNVSSWLQFSSGHTNASIRFSPDYRDLTIYYNGPADGGVNLSLGSGIVDVNGNPLDNDPATTNLDNFNLSFQLAGPQSGDLAGIAFGGGVVTKGIYAFALERAGDLDGAVVVYDCSNPSNAVKLAALKVPGYPRDLALIPQYVYTTTTSKSDCVTNDLLAVVGGKVGDQDLQYLWVLDIGQPTNLTRLASAVVTFAQTAVVKIKWSPPFLAYLENGADSSSISLVNLQTFIIGSLASPELRATFTSRVAGVDADGDGNFCGPNDVLPLPFNSTSDYYGRVTTFAVETTQTILDFDLDSNFGLVGVTLGKGKKVGSDGRPTTQDALPAYRTLVSGLNNLDPDLATYPFTLGDIPRRLAFLPQVLVQTTNSAQQVRNLALVSLDGQTNGPSRLVVLDVTDPLNPTNIATLLIPSSYGNFQSLIRREDGLLALATTQDILLLDPVKLLLPSVGGGLPAAIVGRVEGAGGGTRSFTASTTGLNIVNSGGKHQILQTAPLIDLVSFPGFMPTNAKFLRQLAEPAKANRFRTDQSQSILLKNHFQFAPDSNGVPTNAPPVPATHYYVRADVLGSAGTNIDLYLEAWGANGTPLPSGSSNAVPVHLASTNTLQALGETNQSVYPTAFKAWRLSDDPRSAFYNVYLSDPFVVSDQALNSLQRNSVSNQLAREIVKAGTALWAGFDPSQATNAVLGPYASSISNRRVKPGTARWAKVENVDRPLIFIPGMSGSYLENTNATFPTERWLGWLDRYQQELSLNPSNNIVTSIVASDVVRTILQVSGLDKVKIYAPIINFLTTNAGYVEYRYDKVRGSVSVADKDMYQYRTPDGADYTQVTNSPNLFIFPYDWRVDNAVSARQLKEYVKVIQRFHPDADKVNILAHSMGGLVARRFILDNPGAVDKLITVGTPWVGAPKAIAALETGSLDDFAMNIVVNKSTLRQLAEYFPGMHQLLPSKGYFDLGGRPLIEKGWSMNQDTNYFEIYDYPAYKHTIDDIFHPSTNSYPVLTNESFHSFAGPTNAPVDQRNQQDDWSSDSTGVDYYHIYGVQVVPRTIGQVRGTLRLRQVQPPCNDLRIDLPWTPASDSDALVPVDPNIFDGHDRYVLDRRFEFVRTAGDGTVPVLSASRVNGTNNFNAPDARLLPLYSPSPDHDEDVEHNGILANTNLLNMVQDILNGLEPLVATNNPATNETYLVNLANVVTDSVVVTDGSGGTSAAFQLPITVAGALREWLLQLLPWESEDDENAYVPQFEIVNTQPGNTSHTLSFDIGSQPFSADVYRRSGDATTNLYRWGGPSLTNASGQLIIDWTGHTVSLRVSGSNVPPALVLTGNLAQAESPPVVTNLIRLLQDGHLDGEATESLLLPAHDDVFNTNQITVYLGYDHNESGDIFDEVFRPLNRALLTTNTPIAGSTNQLTFAVPVQALEPEPLTVVAANGAGDVSPDEGVGHSGSSQGSTQSSPPSTTDDTDNCAELRREKTALLSAIQAGVNEVNASGWILRPNPANPSTPAGIKYILEQGSGACFWTSGDLCQSCSNVFTPGVSDHDYEVFLPVFSPYYAGPAPDILHQPYLRANVAGDWYFKPPTTNGNVLVYSFPYGGATNTALGPPLTPANYVSLIFLTKASNSLVASGFAAAAANLSFFAARAEHFENGYIDLELPLESGSDPIGDAGTGRQMLLLKWALEGNYVTGFEGPPLTSILSALTNRNIPSLEGYEWGVYQEFAALSSGALLRVTDVTGVARPEAPAHDLFYEARKNQIKKTGKAAIRAVLAELAGSSLPNRDSLIFIDKPTYAANSYKSFEQYIAGQAKQAMSLFPTLTAADIDDFYKAKVADKTFLSGLLTNQCQANTFLAKAINFIRKVQSDNQSTYTTALAGLPPDEAQSRTQNLQKLSAGFPDSHKPGLTSLRANPSMDLTVRLFNDGPAASPNTQVIMTGGPTATTITTNLPPDSATVVAGKATTQKNFYLQDSANASPTLVTFTIKSDGTLHEGVVTNNWFGFYYYILNLNNPCSFTAPTISPPSNLPQADPDCVLPISR